MFENYSVQGSGEEEEAEEEEEEVSDKVFDSVLLQ